MNATNLVQRARSIKYDNVLAYLGLAFKDFAYPVYLFGSYATGRFHGHSDIDILIIVPDAQSAEAYRQACDKMAGLGMNYDILISPSIERLDGSIAASLQVIQDPLQQRPTSAPRYRHQTGLTLIEIMIALLIGAFLLGGVINIFINSKQTYRMQEGLSRLQENGRFAMDFLTNDIRMAGYKGCGSSVVPNVIANPPLPTALANPNMFALYGNNNVAANWDANACGASNACIAGTDAITYSLGNSCGGSLTGNMATTNANIQIAATNTCNNLSGEVLIISDCSATDIFQATAVASGAGSETIAHSSTGNTSNNLSKLYGPDAEILKFNSITYFIRTGASGQPALWRLDNSLPTSATNPIELIEGIENMQILYGVDLEFANPCPSPPLGCGTPNYYVPANNVVAADWSKVLSTRNPDLCYP